MLVSPGNEIYPHPPNGLLSLAAVLREKNYHISVKDYSGEKLSDQQIKRDIEKNNPSYVGIGVLTGPVITRALQISKVAQELGKKVIWGGPHVTILPTLTIEHPFVDGVVIGEAEQSFGQLVDYFEGKGDAPNGTGFKHEDSYKIMPPQTQFADVNQLPMPAWDLLGNIDKYFPYRKHNSVVISASRGCIYRCGFCHNANKDVNKYGGPYRNLDAERILKEFALVTSLTRKDIDRMDIGGDLHFSTPSYVKKFAEDMIKMGNDIKWNTASTIRVMDGGLADMVVKAGCESIMFGVESGSERIQKMLGKPIDYQKAMLLTNKLRKQGTLVTCTYMMGHPTETLEEVKKTLHYMKTIPSDQNLLQFYRPFPGTPYFDMVVQQKGIEPPQTLEQCATFGVLGSEVNLTNIPTKTLLRIYYRANLVQQTKYLLHRQMFLWKHALYEQFMEGIVQNKFTYKLKEFLISKQIFAS